MGAINVQFEENTQHNAMENKKMQHKLVRISKAVFAVTLALGVVQAHAAGEDWGHSFNDPTEDWDQKFDSSFVKEYESNPQKGHTTLSPKNIEPMKSAIKQYAAIVAKGGWRSINLGKERLRVGMSHPAVPVLRERLAISGDLTQTGGFENMFDDYVDAAVKKFQARHGLTPTGIVDQYTVSALNVPAIARLRQLRTNLVRVQTLSTAAAKRYVMVNIPAAQIEAVENDKVISRHAGVVGKIDRQSPIIRSAIHEINFNPYWTVPASIIRKDLVPQAREYKKQGKNMLEDYKMTVFDGQGKQVRWEQIDWNGEAVYGYRFRQDPWKNNSMGFVKINYPNPHSTYMHDTPSKSLFGQNFRAHSSGCIRVQNVQQLVTWILKDTQEWPANRIEEVRKTGERIDAKVKNPVPVYFVYVTSWATEDGTVHFRRDLYNKDGVQETASVY